jgi:hypothetical protein
LVAGTPTTSRLRGATLPRNGRLARASALLLMHGQRSTPMRDRQPSRTAMKTDRGSCFSNATVCKTFTLLISRGLARCESISAAGLGRRQIPRHHLRPRWGSSCAQESTCLGQFLLIGIPLALKFMSSFPSGHKFSTSPIPAFVTTIARNRCGKWVPPHRELSVVNKAKHVAIFAVLSKNSILLLYD